MSKRAWVSVVIPSYNHASLVVEAIESVLRQTVVPAEILVVDDGSKDDTQQRLVPYREHIRYLFQTNQGVSAARNLGVSAAQGEFIAFLDSDDVWHPRKLELQLEAFARQPTLGLLGTYAFAWPATAFADLNLPTGNSLSFITWEQLIVRNRFTTSSILARKDLLNQAGPFDTQLQGPEDHDMWIRVAELAETANLTLPLTGYRDVAASLSKQAQRMEKGMRRILQKLETRGVWKRRPLLRQKAYSILNHRCGFMYSEAGEHWTALWRSLWALIDYPLPYHQDEVGTPLEKPKRLIRNLMVVLGLLSASCRDTCSA